jgi:hypothetical protein
VGLKRSAKTVSGGGHNPFDWDLPNVPAAIPGISGIPPLSPSLYLPTADLQLKFAKNGSISLPTHATDCLSDAFGGGAWRRTITVP